MFYSETTVYDYENLWISLALGKIKRKGTVWYMRNCKSSWGGVHRGVMKQIYFGNDNPHLSSNKSKSLKQLNEKREPKSAVQSI